MANGNNEFGGNGDEYQQRAAAKRLAVVRETSDERAVKELFLRRAQVQTVKQQLQEIKESAFSTLNDPSSHVDTRASLSRIANLAINALITLEESSKARGFSV